MPSPIVTATVQSAMLSALSNIIAQSIEFYQTSAPLTASSFNPTPVLHFIIYSLISTPPNFLWQDLLESLFPGQVQSAPPPAVPPKSGSSEKPLPQPPATRFSKSNTLKKFLLDQIIGGPINNLLFLVTMASLQGKDSGAIAEAVRRDFWMVQLAGMKLWPAVSVLSFVVVPVQQRVVFGSLVALGWNVYLGLVMG